MCRAGVEHITPFKDWITRCRTGVEGCSSYKHKSVAFYNGVIYTFLHPSTPIPSTSLHLQYSIQICTFLLNATLTQVVASKGKHIDKLRNQ